MTAMNKASKASDQRTEKQEREFRQLMEGICVHATNLALEKIQASKEKWQENVIEKGNQLRTVVADAVLGKLGELTFSLLKRIASAPVPATKEFVLTEEVLKQYNIGWAGENFRKVFLGKKCKAAKAGTTAFHSLQKDSLDPPIIAELGEDAKTAMGHVLWHINQQIKGQAGPLLVNGKWNLAYVEAEDEEGKITPWAVCAGWDSGDRGWGVGADSVGRPYEWDAGSQVLSRDC